MKSNSDKDFAALAKKIEQEAAKRAYSFGLGASEWESVLSVDETILLQECAENGFGIWARDKKKFMKSNEEINAARENLVKFVDELCRRNKCGVLGAKVPLSVLAVVYVDCLNWITGKSPETTFQFTAEAVSAEIARLQAESDAIFDTDILN